MDDGVADSFTDATVVALWFGDVSTLVFAVNNGWTGEEGVGDILLATLVVCISELLFSRALLNGIDDRVEDSAMKLVG